jgi:hypothetical protein
MGGAPQSGEGGERESGDEIFRGQHEVHEPVVHGPQPGRHEVCVRRPGADHETERRHRCDPPTPTRCEQRPVQVHATAFTR